MAGPIAVWPMEIILCPSLEAVPAFSYLARRLGALARLRRARSALPLAEPPISDLPRGVIPLTGVTIPFRDRLDSLECRGDGDKKCFAARHTSNRGP
jgi:hypothetical protein